MTETMQKLKLMITRKANFGKIKFGKKENKARNISLKVTVIYNDCYNVKHDKSFFTYSGFYQLKSDNQKLLHNKAYLRF